jgi:hypothetical protein
MLRVPSTIPNRCSGESECLAFSSYIKMADLIRANDPEVGNTQCFQHMKHAAHVR